MEAREIECFVHVSGADPQVARAAAEDALKDLLIRLNVLPGKPDDGYIFVGECVEALDEGDEIEDGEDQHATVDINLTLAVLEIPRRRHIHVHSCRRIAVEVTFDGRTKRHRFAPNTTVGVATVWARRKFHLDPALAPEYVLQFCNSTARPRSTQHLGDITDGKTCALCFDLVKEQTPRG